jgi:hypothetical protein
VTGAEPRTFTAEYTNLAPAVAVKLGSQRTIKGRSVGSRTVKLDAGASKDPEGEPLRFTWQFSDKKVLRGASVTKSFRRNGSYRVTLTVRDRLGGTSVYRGTIRIGRKPVLRRIGTSSAVWAFEDHSGAQEAQG